MIQVTLTPKTPAQLTQLIRLLEQFNQETAIASTGEPVEVKVEAPAEAKKPRPAKPAPTVATPTETVLAAPSTPSTGTAESGSEVTLEQVRAKLTEMSQAGKASQVKALLSVYGVAKLTDLPKDKYAAILAEAETLA